MNCERHLPPRRHRRVGRELHVALQECTLQRRELRAASPQSIALVDVIDGDRERRAHIASASTSRRRSNTMKPAEIDTNAYRIISSVSASPGRWPKKITS